MTNLTQILILVALVAGGIGTYHVLVADTAEDPALVTHTTLDDGDLSLRIAALEQREPALQGSMDSSVLLSRVRDLEARLKALEKERLHVPADGAMTERDASASGALATGALEESGEDGELSGAIKKQVDRLVEDAMSSRMRGRMSGRLDRSLSELGIELSADQRKKLDEAMAKRMQETRQVLRSGRASGLSREEVGEEISKVSATFTETLSSFMSASDAQALTEATAGPPGGPRGGPGR